MLNPQWMRDEEIAEELLRRHAECKCASRPWDDRNGTSVIYCDRCIALELLDRARKRAEASR